MPNGIYFLTIKESDGPNDTGSNLNREGVFRVSFYLPDGLYQEQFGHRPKRPRKGEGGKTGRDFTEINKLMPHPIYAWMGWVQILSPTKSRWRQLRPFIKESYQETVLKYNKKANT